MCRDDQDHFTVGVVSCLIAMSVALVVLGVFVLDWFVVGRMSIDLWAVCRCDSPAGCASHPLASAGLGGFHLYAAATLWLTAFAIVPVLIQTGGYLLGKRPWKYTPMIGYATGASCIASVLATVYAAGPTLHGSMNAAPFVIVVANALGMIAMYCASSRLDAPTPASMRIPAARVV